jgi:hypothetical protein
VHRATVIERTLGRPVVDIVRPVFGDRVEVMAVVRIEAGFHGFHVLLRHRPRSISLPARHFLAVVRDIGLEVSHHRVVPVAAEDDVVGVPVVVSNLIVAVAADNPIAVSTVRITP